MRPSTLIVVIGIAILAASRPLMALTPLVSGDSITTLDVSSMFTMQHPFISISGGTTSFMYNNDVEFQPSMTIGAVLGFTSTKNVFQSEILKTTQGGAYVTYVKAGDTLPNKVSVETWRFGFENSESYGYPLGSGGTMSLDFSATRAPLSWFSTAFPALGIDSTTKAQMSSRFDEGVRFGESSRASIGLRVAEPVSIGVGFEWAQAYERHMFWFWTMSTVIEGVADGVGSYFVSAVGKSSPMASPIIHFIVRNGIAMGFKALRKNQMNWPFTTAAPLNYYNYSLSVNVQF